MSEGRFEAVSDLKFLSTRPVGLRLEWNLWCEPPSGFSLKSMSKSVGSVMQRLFDEDVHARCGIVLHPSSDIWHQGSVLLEEYCKKIVSTYHTVASGGRLTVGEYARLAVCESFGFMIFSGKQN